MKCSKCEKQGFSVDELLPHGICAECKTVCPHCLHGFRRDTGPNGEDEECFTCDATGFIQ